MRKFLLIFPNPISEMPTGFAYTSAVLKKRGYDVKAIVNTFSHFLSREDFLSAAKEYQPDIIGVNVGTFRVLETYALINALSSIGPVIVGGAHTVHRAEEILRLSATKLVVRGEAEKTLDSLQDCVDEYKPITGVPGISFRKDGLDEIAHNPSQNYIDQLDDLPDPDFECFDQKLFKVGSGWLKGLHRIYCTRGCPAGCTFCDRGVFGNRVRFRSVDKVTEEIRQRKEKFGLTSFVIADDTFTFKKSYVSDFCTALLDKKLRIRWTCSTRANAIDLKTLIAMKEAGCYMVSYGIESGDPETLKRTHKGITLEQAHAAVDQAASLGFRVYVNLMTGFPWETSQAVQNNIAFIRRHFNQVHIFQVSGSLVPYPGTGIYEEFHREYGFTDWWLKEDFQNFGIQIHQNVEDPYKHSTFYQRQLYDDTYVWEEKFFRYSPEYKQAVRKMAFLIGKRNLFSEQPCAWKRHLTMGLCRLSRFVYECDTKLEKKLVSKVVRLAHAHSHFHDRGPLGYIPSK